MGRGQHDSSTPGTNGGGGIFLHMELKAAGYGYVKILFLNLNYLIEDMPHGGMLLRSNMTPKKTTRR